MNKQIEEMCTVINGAFFKDFRNGNCVCIKTISEHLYNAGYRKQIEGEWVKRGNEKTCSLCKFIYYSNNDEWNFCPNCGAHMSGGKNG